MTEESDRETHIFPVETRYHTMAKRPGGVPRKLALQRAQAKIDELKPAFNVWLDRQLQEFIAAVRLLESDPNNLSRLEIAYGKCRQLRNVGTTMGFELVTFISDILCDSFEAIKAGAAYQKETIDCQIDALVLASKPPYCTLSPEQLPEMTSGLREVVERVKSLVAK